MYLHLKLINIDNFKRTESYLHTPIDNVKKMLKSYEYCTPKTMKRSKLVFKVQRFFLDQFW